MNIRTRFYTYLLWFLISAYRCNKPQLIQIIFVLRHASFFALIIYFCRTVIELFRIGWARQRERIKENIHQVCGSNFARFYKKKNFTPFLRDFTRHDPTWNQWTFQRPKAKQWHFLCTDFLANDTIVWFFFLRLAFRKSFIFISLSWKLSSTGNG